jgi:hypothetical protein
MGTVRRLGRIEIISSDATRLRRQLRRDRQPRQCPGRPRRSGSSGRVQTWDGVYGPTGPGNACLRDSGVSLRWETSDMDRVAAAPAGWHGIHAVADDLSLVALSLRDHVLVLDHSGHQVARFGHHPWANSDSELGCCVFAPDGRHLWTTVPTWSPEQPSMANDELWLIDLTAWAVRDRRRLNVAAAGSRPHDRILADIHPSGGEYLTTPHSPRRRRAVPTPLRRRSARRPAVATSQPPPERPVGPPGWLPHRPWRPLGPRWPPHWRARARPHHGQQPAPTHPT